jgi:hypoxanthine phosphoribosyltransferase
MEKHFITPLEYHHLCYKLATTIAKSGFKPDLLLGLWRGGAQPCNIISEVFEYLNIPTEHNIIKCHSYDNTNQHEVIFDKLGQDFINMYIKFNANVLIIDDIFDTGRTMQAVINNIHNTSNIKIATVFYKPHANLTNIKPDFTAQVTDKWIVFPNEIAGLTAPELKQKDPYIASLISEL